MKIRIVRAQGLINNHNQGGLKIKPQITAALLQNHNMGALKLK